MSANNQQFRRPGTSAPGGSRDGDTNQFPRVGEHDPRPYTNERRPQRTSWLETFRRNYTQNRDSFRRVPSMNRDNGNTPRPSATRKIGFGDLSIVLKGAVVAAFFSLFSVLIWIPMTLSDFTDKMEKSGAKAKFDYFGVSMDWASNLGLDKFSLNPLDWSGQVWMFIIIIGLVIFIVRDRRKRNNSQASANNH